MKLKIGKFEFEIEADTLIVCMLIIGAFTVFAILASHVGG